MAAKPINVNSGCSSLIKNINKTDGSMQETTIDGIKNGFEDSPEFEIVYKNFNFKEKLKTWVTNGNMDDKTIGYKTLYSYPYKEIMFKIGDYIHFNYKHEDENTPSKWKTWLLESLDTQHLYNITGRLLPCNQNIRWIKNGNIVDYPCYLENSMKYTTLNFGTQGFVVPNADVVVYIQNNEETKDIDINTRFIFNSKAFVVVQLNDAMNKGYVMLYMNKIAELPEDDLVNNIAFNGEIIEKDEKRTGDYILPEISSIGLNETVDFSVYEYINGEAMDVGFDIIVSGLDNSYYDLDIIDDNNFRLTNKKTNYQNFIKIICKNKISKDVKELAIWLKGGF